MQPLDVDVFRIEFIGRHHGLRWLRDFVYPIPRSNIKLMAMRVLYGMAAEPFGLEDILHDKKMLAVYEEMVDFKDAVWDTKVGVKAGSALIMHSRHVTVRLKMHRVADFLSLEHRNGTRKSSDGKHTVRMVIVRTHNKVQKERKMDGFESDVLEVARERTLDECFEICLEGSASEIEAVRTAATAVLVILAKKVKFLEMKTYEELNSRLLQCRLDAINAEDDIMYEEICSALVHLRATKRHLMADFSFGFETEAELFDMLWMYHHMSLCRFVSCKTLSQLIKRPFWSKASAALSEEVLALITKSKDTPSEKKQALLHLMRDVNLDETTETHFLERMEDGGVSANQFIVDKHSSTNQKSRNALQSGFRKSLQLVRARGPQDDRHKHKAAATRKALGKIMDEKDAEIYTKGVDVKEKRKQKKKKNDKQENIKVMNPLLLAGNNPMNAETEDSEDRKTSAPEINHKTTDRTEIESVPAASTVKQLPPTHPDQVHRMNLGGDSSSSDESADEDAVISMKEQKQQMKKIRSQLEMYAVIDTEKEPLEFQVTYRQRKALHLIASNFNLVHYSKYDPSTKQRVLIVEKPTATTAEKKVLKRELVKFYQASPWHKPIEFDTTTELRKYLHAEAEALRLVHFSNWDEVRQKKILRVAKPHITKRQKKQLTKQLVEYSADESATEPLSFDVTNELRKFIRGVCDGLGLHARCEKCVALIRVADLLLNLYVAQHNIPKVFFRTFAQTGCRSRWSGWANGKRFSTVEGGKN
eukprot:SAG31_NODE_2841_length_5015_cov_1.524817_7_plen_759_part_00